MQEVQKIELEVALFAHSSTWIGKLTNLFTHVGVIVDQEIF